MKCLLTHGGMYEWATCTRGNDRDRCARLSLLREPGESNNHSGRSEAIHPSHDVERWGGFYAGQQFGPVRLSIQEYRCAWADRRADPRGAVGLAARITLAGHWCLLHWLGAGLRFDHAGRPQRGHDDGRPLLQAYL